MHPDWTGLGDALACAGPAGIWLFYQELHKFHDR
jgi:hypothetical protein